ncbi:hypothetical protein GCM10009624_20030 [Gordonia sinesedis]
MSGPCGVLTPDDIRELVGDGNVTKASVINDGCEWITSAGGGVSYTVEKSTSAPDQAGSRTIRTADGDLLASPASEKSGNCIATMVPTRSLERGTDYLYESLGIVIMPAESSTKSSSVQGKSVCERSIPQIAKMLRGTGLAE